MEPSRLYGHLMRCEDRSAQLYLDVSVRFYDQVEISWFWIEMAMEEKQHAGLLQYCLEQGIFANELPPVESVVKLERLLEKVELHAADPALSLDAAFDLAIEIEASGMEDISQKLTAPIVSPPHVLQRKLELSQKKHIDKLRTAAERFAASPRIRARLAEMP
jgi:hypothetical protein